MIPDTMKIDLEYRLKLHKQYKCLFPKLTHKGIETIIQNMAMEGLLNNLNNTLSTTNYELDNINTSINVNSAYLSDVKIPEYYKELTDIRDAIITYSGKK